MSHCKKFAPNIFHKTKCSNCFRQKEEHSAEALECNRASRSIARSGYLFVAPDWDFSVPLNRTKRWQRRWFVLYDDGELIYSVDEHPDTIPQGSVDMSKVLEVTAAEQITGHPHSVALTSPDRVTFIKAASREDARWWVELLAMFPRKHKRNATFPGGRASPSLPQLGRSASPQPPRPRFLSCTSSGPSPRTNFETPPLKEERETPSKDDQRPKWLPEPTKTMTIEVSSTPTRSEYVVSSGSPPTRDKLRGEDKARARRDWRNERLRDIATALTDRSPESSLALPAEGLLHLKKGWLWLKTLGGEWVRRWIVLCVPTLAIYHDQDEQLNPESTVELSSVTSYNEVVTESKYGFAIHWSEQVIILCAVTAGIRANWLEALKKACPATPTPSDISTSPTTTTRSVFLSSDDEYKTASENDRRFSGDWSELPPSPPSNKLTACRLKDRVRIRSRFSRCQSRQNTIDSTSTDELDSVKETEHIELSNTLNKQNLEIHDLQNQLSRILKDKSDLEEEIARLKKLQSEAMTYEKSIKDLIANFERTEKELNQRNSQTELKFTKEQKTLQHQLTEAKEAMKNSEERVGLLTRELHTKQHVILSLQNDLSNANENYAKVSLENENLQRKMYELETRYLFRNPKNADSLTSLIDINLEIDIEDLGTNELKEYTFDLKSRFEKAVLEIQSLKKRLREANENIDRLEIVNYSLEESMKMMKNENEAEVNLLINRLEHLTSKLLTAEKQLRTKSKTDQREKRRSLSLKGRESFSINKEVEDKVTELEAKIVAIEKGNKPRRKHKRDIKESNDRSSPIDDKSLRRLRRKSLDSATASESIKLLMRLSTLESKVTDINISTESLNVSSSVSDLSKLDEHNKTNSDNFVVEAKSKLCECICQLNNLKNNRNKRSLYPSAEKLSNLERNLNELADILNNSNNVVSSAEIGVIQSSADSVVKQFENILIEKLTELYEKRRYMIDSNNYDNNAKLHFLAEKIAFENIMIGRIQEAFNITTNGEASCDRLISKEIKETAFLINSLKNKFNGKNPLQAPESKTSAKYLSRTLAKALINVAHGFKNFKKYHTNAKPSLHLLMEEQQKLENQLTTYKSIKLPQLADALALETMLSIPENGTSKSVTNETKHHFTQSAREKINVELMQAEINHVFLRAAQIYQSNLNSDSNYFFSFFASERAALELWADSVEDHLYDEISKNINELTELYQNSLNKLQRQNWRRKLESERVNDCSSNLLNELADIIAHKTLIDARISVLSGKFHAHCVEKSSKMDNVLNNLINFEESWNLLDNQSTLVNQTLEAEFLSIVERYSKDYFEVIERPGFETVLNCLNAIASEISQFQQQMNVPVKSKLFRDWKDICTKCSELRDELVQIRLSLKTSFGSTKFDNTNFQRPVHLGNEYLTQVESLRSAYRCVLASCKGSHQESDIEQLKLLCERVLVSMEQWHHQTIQEMREKHAQEMEMLRQEKEQALHEETQATLAALDAMRKAHEAEVQKEVAKFKQEFARQQRNEVLELSEKLSVKRLEAAALSEQLGSASRQLAHAQQHILALERNPQLAKFQV